MGGGGDFFLAPHREMSWSMSKSQPGKHLKTRENLEALQSPRGVPTPNPRSHPPVGLYDLYYCSMCNILSGFFVGFFFFSFPHLSCSP